jgi:hypothetical protein
LFIYFFFNFVILAPKNSGNPGVLLIKANNDYKVEQERPEIVKNKNEPKAEGNVKFYSSLAQKK